MRRWAPGALLAVGLALSGTSARSGPEETVRVFGAASLGDVLRALATRFEAAHRARVELNLAGTQVLRTQVEQGASADVYAFADLDHAQALQARGLVQPHRILARNLLCVATPVQAPRVRALADMARPGTKVVMAEPSVPAGRYAAEWLQRMEQDPAFGPAFRKGVLANLVSREPSVRLVLAKVALGEADAGVVYVTDARGNERVRALAVPERLNVVAVYTAGLVQARASPAARAFLEVMLGTEGQQVLRAHGFLPPP
jgi:molybdate transport system substrate-binding protein